MDSQVCVICSNKKDINRTNNRLVTESCGHVKCMECLLQEKSGCIACQNEINGDISNGVRVANIERKKPDIPHIKVELGKLRDLKY